MVEIARENVECRRAASVGLLADFLRISKRCLLIACASTCDSSFHLHLLFTRVRCCSSETCASCKRLLCRRSAGQATRLAPTKQTICLAILGAVLTCCRVALGTGLGNANGRGEAIVELVMVEVPREN